MGINIRRAYQLENSQQHLMDNFKSILTSNEKTPFIIQIASSLITLKIPQAQQRWWSPEMNLRVEADEQGTQLYEVIGPNPSIFTLAMFFVILGSVTFVAGLTMAFSLMYLGNSPTWAIIATLLSGLVVAAALLVLAVGRIKAADQVCQLRQFVDEVTQE